MPERGPLIPWHDTAPMNTPHRKRCKRYDVAGDAHFMTFSCFRRLPLFARERTCAWMLDALQLGRSQRKFDLWAYVVMPEHVHVVLLPQPGVKISAILSTLKQSVSKRAIRWLRENSPEFLARLEDAGPAGRPTHRFWQRGGGYDRNLRTISDVYEKIEYVHGNPLRRGLVTRAAAWRWSSCHAWETGEDAPIPLDRESLPPLL
jgi:putative transposase